MLGIEDPWVAAAYILCLASTLLCVVYGIVNWNKGDEPETDELDRKWAEHEVEVEEEL